MIDYEKHMIKDDFHYCITKEKLYSFDLDDVYVNDFQNNGLF